jgi:hypothetical protein
MEPLRMPGGPAIECVTLKEGPPGIDTQAHVQKGREFAPGGYGMRLSSGSLQWHWPPRGTARGSYTRALFRWSPFGRAQIPWPVLL